MKDIGTDKNVPAEYEMWCSMRSTRPGACRDVLPQEAIWAETCNGKIASRTRGPTTRQHRLPTPIQYYPRHHLIQQPHQSTPAGETQTRNRRTDKVPDNTRSALPPRNVSATTRTIRSRKIVSALPTTTVSTTHTPHTSLDSDHTSKPARIPDQVLALHRCHNDRQCICRIPKDRKQKKARRQPFASSLHVFNYRLSDDCLPFWLLHSHICGTRAPTGTAQRASASIPTSYSRYNKALIHPITWILHSNGVSGSGAGESSRCIRSPMRYATTPVAMTNATAAAYCTNTRITEVERVSDPCTRALSPRRQDCSVELSSSVCTLEHCFHR